MSDVTLLAAVHDPEGRIGALLADDLPRLQRHYRQIVALCGIRTVSETVECLRAHGVTVLSGENIPLNARPYALGVITAHPEWAHVHLCDFDSALHWARAWPDELDRVNATIAQYDFLLLGRTARAIASLPEAQRETERLINLLFARTTGGLDPWRLIVEPETLGDICAGAWGLSQRGAAALRTDARRMDIGFHAEWPLIARETPALRSAYLPCEGLEYETADRYADAIAAAGGLDAWHAAQGAQISHWQQRISYITQIADAITGSRRQAAGSGK